MTENNFITYLKRPDRERKIILGEMDHRETIVQAEKEYINITKYSEQTPTTQLYQRGRCGSHFNENTELKRTEKSGGVSLS